MHMFWAEPYSFHRLRPGRPPYTKHARPDARPPIHDNQHHGPRKIGEAAGAGRVQQDRCVFRVRIRPVLAELPPTHAHTRPPGGKGTVRRKIVRKTKPSTAQDDKKLQGALKKLNVQPIPGVEEVNMFREDGNVLHFSTPKGTSRVPLAPPRTPARVHAYRARILRSSSRTHARAFSFMLGLTCGASKLNLRFPVLQCTRP